MEKSYTEFVTAYRAAYSALPARKQLDNANEEWRNLKKTLTKEANYRSPQLEDRLKKLREKQQADKARHLNMFFGRPSNATLKATQNIGTKSQELRVGPESHSNVVDNTDTTSLAFSDKDKDREKQSLVAKEQEKVRLELESVNLKIDSLERIRALVDSEKNDADLREYRKLRTKLNDRLRVLKSNAQRQQKYRDNRRKIIAEAVSEYPDLGLKLKRICRERPGRPGLEEDPEMSELHRVIIEIAGASSSVDRRRNAETFHCCRTLDDLVQELSNQGLCLSRSAAYLRLIPRRTDTRQGRRHVSSVPVKLMRAANVARKDHIDSRFAAASIHYLEELAGLFGENLVFFLSQDDKSRVPLGLTAANLQAPILMRFEADYRVTLPDHDFVIADRHKLIPSVYAGCVVTDAGKVSYSGPTYIAIRSGKHNKSTAASHFTDFCTAVELPEFCDVATDGSGSIKPILMVTVDGGPDECPRFPKVISAWVAVFRKFNLDALFVATNAPGHSAFNRVERRMAPLSRDLSGLIFPHDRFGSHLDSAGRTTDENLEKENFEFAGKCLAEVWAETVIDDFPVRSAFIPVNAGESSSEIREVEKSFRRLHIRTSQYVLQVVKCHDASCCSPWRSNFGEIFPGRFILPPIRYVPSLKGPVPDQPNNVSRDGQYKPYAERILLSHLDPKWKRGPLPFDFYCPSVLPNLEKRTCARCGLYEATKVALQGHMCLSDPDTMAENTTVDALSDDENEILPRFNATTIAHALPLISKDNIKEWFEDGAFISVDSEDPDNSVILNVRREPDLERPYNIIVLAKDRALCEDIGGMVSDRLLSAFLVRTEVRFRNTHVGFEDPGDISLRCVHPSRRIKQGIKEGKTCVQILYTGKKHYVTTVYAKSLPSVFYYDSLGLAPSPQVKTQIRFLYSEFNENLKIALMPTQRQSSAGNNCAFRAAMFAVDVCFGLDCNGACYQSELLQREWFFKIIEGGDISCFPRSSEAVQMTVKSCKTYYESDEVRLISEDAMGFHAEVIEHTGTKDIRNAPDDRLNVAFLLMIFLGMSSSYAWNFFVTASDYFRYSFRNVTNPDIPTELQAVFENSLAVTGTAIGLIGVFISTVLTRYISFQKRITAGFVIIVIVFIATTVLAEVDTDSWQNGFFGVTMLNIVVISFSSNSVIAALFGVQGCLPSRFATAIMVGQALAGIVAAFAMIISVLSGRGDAGDNQIKAEACGFFASAAVMSVIAVFGFLLFLRLDFVKFYMFPPPDQVVITDIVETRTVHEEPVIVTKENFNVRLVFGRTWKHGLTLILNFTVTLALFPAVATMVKSTNSSSGSLVNNQLFLPLACFLVLNCSDLAGRLAHGFLQWPTPDQGFLAIVIAILRFVFIPLLMLCNAQPRSHLSVIFGDGAFVGILTGLVFTNGYLGNLGIMYGPKLVPPEFAETTGSLMGFCIMFGLFLGASLSFALTALL